MEFRLLGPLEVDDDGGKIPLGGPKQRALLALLLLERGRPVPTQRLIDAIWFGDPPATAPKSVQVYVSGLRKALGESRIMTRPGGYELRAERTEVDLDRFEELARTAAGAPDVERARLLHDALALVRGEPLADLALEPWAPAETAYISERIIDVNEARINADLRLGRHREVVPELERLVGEHPFRERLLEQLMLALYGSGRQADALEAYRRAATRMRDELGLEPGRPLQDLQRRILQQEPSLELPERVEDRSVRPWRKAAILAMGALAVVAIAGAATVAASRGDPASLRSLDPGVAILEADSGALVAHVPKTEIPEPVEVVAGSGSFWVWNLSPYSLVEISPDTGAILNRIGSPFSGDAGWYLPERESVWFTGPTELVRVNADEGRAAERFRLNAARHRIGNSWVARCDGSLWVASIEEDRVLRIDPATGAIQARIRTPDAWAVACGAGGLWVTSGGVGLRRIDPATNRIAATATIPIHFYSIAVGGGYAWTTDETSGTLYKVDPTGRVVATYETGDGARQLAFAHGHVWVANADAGTVTGIDAATGAARTYRFGHPVLTVGALGDRILVGLDDGLTYEDRIDALEGDVVKLLVPIYVFDPPDPALAWNPWIFEVERATCATLLSRPPGTSGGLRPELASALPRVSADGRTYTFTLRPSVRFAPRFRPGSAVRPGGRLPPSASPLVTAAAVRFSVERALSPKLGSDAPAIRFLDDVVGARTFAEGDVRRITGVRVRGNRISFTLIRPSADFLERLSLPFFCTVPLSTPVVEGGVQPLAPPSAGPYYMSDRFNGEYMVLLRNPNYTGPRPAKLDAIAFREGLSPEAAVGRVASGDWDGVIHSDALLAPDGIAARRAAASDALRHKVLPVGGLAFPDAAESLYALLSNRLGCDAKADELSLATLCIQDE